MARRIKTVRELREDAETVRWARDNDPHVAAAYSKGGNGFRKKVVGTSAVIAVAAFVAYMCAWQAGQ